MDENNNSSNGNSIDDIAELRFLNDEDVVFERTEGGFLQLELDGQLIKRVLLSRAFPLSRPFEYITVRKVEDNREPGKELGIIEDMRTLSEEKQKIITDELERRYFCPEVTRVLSLKDEYGYIYMNIMCDAGLKKIMVHHNASGFVRLSQVRLMIVDIDGNRYNISDVTKLDSKSYRLLELVL